MGMTFFSRDGSYGNVAGLTVLDTYHWSDSDWERVEKVSDSQRLSEALRVSIAVNERRIKAVERSSRK